METYLRAKALPPKGIEHKRAHIVVGEFEDPNLLTVAVRKTPPMSPEGPIYP